MSKLARKMFAQFVSFTNAPTAATATETHTGASITAVSVAAATFATKVSSVAGTYLFTYDGTDWKLAGATVTLTQYGITVTGTPANGNTISVVFVPAGTGWSVLGHDVDDLSKDMNPDTETKKNVLGESAFEHKGYEPEVSVDTYYADASDAIYEKLLENAMNEDHSETNSLGYYADAVFSSYDDATKIATGYAWVQRAWIVPQSLGGDTSGFNIPFNVNPVGARTKKNISYNAATYVPTFTDIT